MCVKYSQQSSTLYISVKDIVLGIAPNYYIEKAVKSYWWNYDLNNLEIKLLYNYKRLTPHLNSLSNLVMDLLLSLSRALHLYTNL